MPNDLAKDSFAANLFAKKFILFLIFLDSSISFFPYILFKKDSFFNMDISDNVVVLDYGQIIADGPPDEVRANQEVIDAYLGVSHD